MRLRDQPVLAWRVATVASWAAWTIWVSRFSRTGIDDEAIVVFLGGAIALAVLTGVAAAITANRLHRPAASWGILTTLLAGVPGVILALLVRDRKLNSGEGVELANAGLPTTGHVTREGATAAAGVGSRAPGPDVSATLAWLRGLKDAAPIHADGSFFAMCDVCSKPITRADDCWRARMMIRNASTDDVSSGPSFASHRACYAEAKERLLDDLGDFRQQTEKAREDLFDSLGRLGQRLGSRSAWIEWDMREGRRETDWHEVSPTRRLDRSVQKAALEFWDVLKWVAPVVLVPLFALLFPKGCFR